MGGKGRGRKGWRRGGGERSHSSSHRDPKKALLQWHVAVELSNDIVFSMRHGIDPTSLGVAIPTQVLLKLGARSEGLGNNNEEGRGRGSFS